jgi:hypothetical protein
LGAIVILFVCYKLKIHLPWVCSLELSTGQLHNFRGPRPSFDNRR